MITGSLVAIVTPMQEDGRLDMARFRALIDWHVAEGTDGIVVVGTTGVSRRAASSRPAWPAKRMVSVGMN